MDGGDIYLIALGYTHKNDQNAKFYVMCILLQFKKDIKNILPLLLKTQVKWTISQKYKNRKNLKKWKGNLQSKRDLRDIT